MSIQAGPIAHGGLVALALAQREAITIVRRPGPLEFERTLELPMPNQTVTAVIDYAKGVVDIFAEQEPHPEDWNIACDLIRALCSSGDIGEPDYLKGVDTFRVQLKR